MSDKFLHIDTDGLVKEKSLATSAGITVYSVTTADCENTASEIDVISFTVPANTWKDGETIEIIFTTQVKQNSGSTYSILHKGKVESTETLSISQNYSNNGAEANIQRKVFFMRQGSYLYSVFGYDVGPYLTPLPSGILTGISTAYLTTNSSNARGSRFNTFDFTANITIKLTAKWSAAHVNAYYRILEATAYKLNS